MEKFVPDTVIAMVQVLLVVLVPVHVILALILLRNVPCVSIQVTVPLANLVVGG